MCLWSCKLVYKNVCSSSEDMSLGKDWLGTWVMKWHRFRLVLHFTNITPSNELSPLGFHSVASLPPHASSQLTLETSLDGCCIRISQRALLGNFRLLCPGAQNLMPLVDQDVLFWTQQTLQWIKKLCCWVWSFHIIHCWRKNDKYTMLKNIWQCLSSRSFKQMVIISYYYIKIFQFIPFWCIRSRAQAEFDKNISLRNIIYHGG